MKKVILDTDPGIDDLLAILLAASSPECDLLGVTTVSGNCHVFDGTRHALGMKALLEALDFPICMGCHRPLVRSLKTQMDLYGKEERIPIPHDPDWKQKIDVRHGVNFLLEQAQTYAGELVLFPLGPLTNVAAAIIMDQSFANNIQEIILMGGAARVPGNARPTVEFNFLVDPEAAAVVFGSGIPITMVGLDVTGKAALYSEDAARLHSLGTIRSDFIYKLTQHYISSGRPCVLFDPLAVAVGLLPELLIEAPEAFVAVDTSGELTAGTSVCDFSGKLGQRKNARVALRVDSEAFMKVFWERVVGPGQDRLVK